MKNFKLILLLFTICYFLFALEAYASSYVLPYPSFMPGSKFYRMAQILEKVQQYWSFGDLAQFKYHLKWSDKYLVETKTLFEYGQHFLAIRALKKSDDHFQRAILCLGKAQQEGKNISQKQVLLNLASLEHKRVLKQILTTSPKEIIWQEEKKESQTLLIKDLLEQAIKIREIL